MKNKYIAALLAFFLGTFGFHQFYLGNIGKGFLFLIFCWTGIATLLSIIDGIILMLRDEIRFDEKYNSKYIIREVYYDPSHLQTRNTYGAEMELSPLEKIEELHSLKLRGVITEESFRREKGRILSYE
jgi:TM2 domain-containing membrane protein YozV